MAKKKTIKPTEKPNALASAIDFRQKVDNFRNRMMTLFIVITLSCAGIVAISRGQVDDKQLLLSDALRSSHEQAQTVEKLEAQVAKFKKMECYE